MNVANWARALSRDLAALALAVESGVGVGSCACSVESLASLLPDALLELRGFGEGWRVTQPEAEGRYLVATLRGVEVGLYEFGHWHTAEGDRRIGVSHWRPLPAVPS